MVYRSSERRQRIFRKKMFLIKNDKGFTLIETLVAIVIIAFALSSLIMITTKGFGGVTKAASKSRATYIAQDQIERGIAHLQGSLENEDSDVSVPSDINTENETVTLFFRNTDTGEVVSIISKGKTISSIIKEKEAKSFLLTFLPYKEQ